MPTFVYMTKDVFFLCLIAISIFTFGCRQDLPTKTDGFQLSFSTDTLTFDTVFTTLGSVTKRFKVRNTGSDPIRLQEVRIKGGDQSMFRMNVDGISGSSVRDVDIDGNDSIFIFVEVTVDPQNSNNPLVVLEEIEFVTPSSRQRVILEAWGQDAYYYYPDQLIGGLPPFSYLSSYDNYFPISSNITLPNDKPHVIFGYLHIDSLINLTIPAGTQLHFYQGAGLWAYKESSLQVLGEQGNEVVFQGFRLEEQYDDVPGQWDRIWINESSTDSYIEHAIIKNAFIGIQAEPFPIAGPTPLLANEVVVKRTQIQNMDGVGVLARNYNVIMENSLLFNSANQLVAIQGGGNHRFTHCTLANYWPFGGRSSGSVFASNAYNDAFGELVEGDLKARFNNCIVYGQNREEIEFDSVDTRDFNIKFQHSIIKSELDTVGSGKFNTCLVNPTPTFGFFDPLFETPGLQDFSLYESSVAVDYGISALSDTITVDLTGAPRDANPDAGCYEYR